jgi:hypothetical protein
MTENDPMVEITGAGSLTLATEVAFPTATWTTRNLLVRVLGETTGIHGETRISVCKATATNIMYSFSVRPEELA